MNCIRISIVASATDPPNWNAGESALRHPSTSPGAHGFRSHLEVVRDIIFAGAGLGGQRIGLIRWRRLRIARRVGVVHRIALRRRLIFGAAGHRDGMTTRTKDRLRQRGWTLFRSFFSCYAGRLQQDGRAWEPGEVEMTTRYDT